MKKRQLSYREYSKLLELATKAFDLQRQSDILMGEFYKLAQIDDGSGVTDLILDEAEFFHVQDFNQQLINEGLYLPLQREALTKDYTDEL